MARRNRSPGPNLAADQLLRDRLASFKEELEGGVIACHVDYISSPKTPTCEVPSNGVVEISLLPVRTGETSI